MDGLFLNSSQFNYRQFYTPLYPRKDVFHYKKCTSIQQLQSSLPGLKLEKMLKSKTPYFTEIICTATSPVKAIHQRDTLIVSFFHQPSLSQPNFVPESRFDHWEPHRRPEPKKTTPDCWLERPFHYGYSWFGC